MNRIQIYTGNGKGKTTAALGLCLRSLGAGGKVCLIQFDKGADPGREAELYSERSVLRLLNGLSFFSYGSQRFEPLHGTFRFENLAIDREEALRGLSQARETMTQGFSLLVLDEVLSLVMTKLISTHEVMAFLDDFEAAGRPCELLLTGHATWEALVARVDLVTEMRKRKHYFDQGEGARRGIEF